MNVWKPLQVLCVTVFLGACSGGGLTSGNALGNSAKTVPPVDVTTMAPMRVSSFTVVVPETLTVSEQNTYDPSTDIVWRGDPFGDRFPQVQAIVESGVQKGISKLTGDVPVTLDIVVWRFHSQTERTRYSVGGDYEISYDLTVRAASDGSVLIPTYRVDAIADAPGGDDALVAERAGRTEKIDNINLMAASIVLQLTGRYLASEAVAAAAAPSTDP